MSNDHPERMVLRHAGPNGSTNNMSFKNDVLAQMRILGFASDISDILLQYGI